MHWLKQHVHEQRPPSHLSIIVASRPICLCNANVGADVGSARQLIVNSNREGAKK